VAPSGEPLRWGVIGPGYVATRAVIPAILASGTGDVVAVASRDAARAAAVAADFAVPRAYSDYASLLADPAVEAVYLALPNHLHRPRPASTFSARSHWR
jgi:xylose dehydrogenase (NAD/NADP)